MTLKEMLTQRIASKEAFDTALVNLNRSNRDRLGTPEERSEDGRTVLKPRKAYYLDLSMYYNEQGSGIEAPEDIRRILGQGIPDPVSGRSYDYLHHTRWWLLREFLRYAAGLYETTTSLSLIVAQFPYLAPHIKSGDEDKLAVYYTPDAQAGERDVQVQTTIGRLVRKLYPHVPDETVRDIEAQHRAEMSDEIEFLTGADLVRCYELQTPASWSNCMGKPRHNWARLNGHHPVEPYDAPGFALAVVRKADGDVAARALTWTNPEDDTDKRYVRIYGDMSLEKRLIRRGFVAAGLDGARLRKIVLGSDDDSETVVVPYLDRVKGQSGGRKEGIHVVLDGDWLRVVGSDSVRTYNNANVYPVGAQMTSAMVTIPKRTSTEALMFTCAFTGQRHLKKTSTPMVVASLGSPPGYTTPEVASDQIQHHRWKWARWEHEGGMRTALVAPDIQTFDHEGTTYVDTSETRSSLGYSRLSQKYYHYPDSDWTLAHSGTRCVQTPFGDDWHEVMVGDVVEAIVKNLDDVRLVKCHKSEVADKKVWSRIHRVHDKWPTYVHRDVAVVTTGSGRKVVPGLHSVTQLYDGRWEFWRNVSEFYVFDMAWRKRSGETADAATVAAAIAPKIIEEYSCTFASLHTANPNMPSEWYRRKKAWWLQAKIRRVFGGIPCFDKEGHLSMVNVSTWRSEGAETQSIENMREFKRTIERAASNNWRLVFVSTMESDIHDLLLKTVVPQILAMIFADERNEVHVLNASDERFAVAA